MCSAFILAARIEDAQTANELINSIESFLQKSGQVCSGELVSKVFPADTFSNVAINGLFYVYSFTSYCG